MPKASPLTSVAATREVLERYGLATKKALGQHFLINDGIVSRICDLAEVGTEDYVLEVGPGIGTLTLALLDRARGVIAVERDRDLPAVLADTCGHFRDSLALIEKDALEVTVADIRKASGDISAHRLPNKFVSNLPYAVAATIILDFFETFTFLDSATVMVQKEVAERICATSGSKAYGAYTVKLSLYAEPVGRFTVGPKNFFPPPRVDSTVVRLDRVETLDGQDDILDESTRRATCIMIDAAFANRRKTILNSSKAYFAVNNRQNAIDELPAVLERAGIPANVRGESLEKSDYLRLGKAFLECGEGM